MEVNAHSSKIQLLTSDNKTSNHFPVKISSDKGNSFGVLKKYDVKSQQLIASEITEEENIKKAMSFKHQVWVGILQRIWL